MNLALWQKCLVLCCAPLLINSLALVAVQQSLVQATFLSGTAPFVVSVTVIVNLLFVAVFVGFFRLTLGTRLQTLLQNTDAGVGDRPERAVLAGSDELALLDARIHKMAAALKRAADKEKAILAYASDIICTLDASGRCLSMNQASKRLWGYEPSQLIDKDLFAIVSPADRERLVGDVRSVCQKSIPGEYEVRVTREDGSVADTLWSMYWSSEHALVVAVVHDITVRKAAERLQQEVTAMVSHDIRGPLATALMFIKSLEKGVWGELPRELLETGAKSKRLVERLLSLTDDILAYASMESGEVSLNIHELDLSAVVSDALHAVNAIAQESQVHFKTAGTAAFALGDHNRLVQVLINLLANAVKYSPAGAEVSVLVSESEGHVLVQVCDKGPGVSDENKKLIFQMFKQAQSPTTKSGSGLGLAICKRIVEGHGGRIGVSDVPGGGSVFWFKIPKEARPAAGAETV